MSKKGWIILIIIIGVIWYMNSDDAGKKTQPKGKSSYQSTEEGNGNGDSTNPGKGTKLPTPVFTVPPVSCSSCNGGGRCKYCAGTGIDDFQTRMKEKMVRCNMCSGSGGCGMCKGDGIVNK
mgnify:CR=1 FL=1